MNWQERRRQGITKKPATYTYTQEQLKAEVDKLVNGQIDKIKMDTVEVIVPRTFATFALSLHDEFGFGAERINRLLEKVNNQFECIDAGTVSLDDMLQECEKIGIKFMREWKE